MQETQPLTNNERQYLDKPKKKNKCGKFFKAIFKKSFRPQPNIFYPFTVFMIIFVLFITLGIVILLFSKEINEFKIRYDNNDDCKIGTSCTIPIKISHDLEEPVFVYYQIEGFYQNHRTFIQSIPYDQLDGKRDHSDEVEECDNILRNEDLGFDVFQAKNPEEKNPLDPKAIAIPCGIAAATYFNDTYSLYEENNQQVPISDKGIAFESDKKHSFRNSDLTRQWIDIENERFINWMKVSPFSTFRKTWGVINKDIKSGKYNLVIENKWDSDLFDGKKWFVLSEVNVFGGKNWFLGYAFIAFGSLSFVLGFLFLVIYLLKNKNSLDQNNPEINYEPTHGQLIYNKITI